MSIVMSMTIAGMRKEHWKKLTKGEKEARLRAAATESEKRLLIMLNMHPLTMGRFLFQAYVEGFFPDFSFPHSRLIVELDGSVHRGRAARVADSRRSAKLAGKGWRVLRFWNSELAQPELVLHKIISRL